MFRKKDARGSKLRLIVIFVLVLALGAAAGWYWQQMMADKLVRASIAMMQQNNPNLRIDYAKVEANAFAKSVTFDDLTVSNSANSSLRIKELSLQKLQLENDHVTHAIVSAQNFGLHSGNRTFAGDVKFEFTGNADATEFRFDDLFFEDLASKSTVKWKSLQISGIARANDAISHFDSAMDDLRLHVVESDGRAHDPAPMKVKLAYDKTPDGLNHVRQFSINEMSGKFLFGIDHIAAQLADRNFAFLVEKIKIPAEYNPLAEFGYGDFVLNLATSGTMMQDAYQLRQEIVLQDGFHFKILINLDPAILDLAALNENTNFVQKVKQLLVEYRDLSLLQRIYARLGAEQMKISGQQMVAGLAAAYGLDKDPTFTPSLNAIQNFMAQPGNLRMTMQPKPGLDMSNTMGLAMTNPAELARQLQLQFSQF
ncbi:MAG: hypothetical protein EYC62_03965 [Alphaproteobacteria bacterium]|nr:MAG: hypothetical protein EYC62_03965 [Alphaproteobacteria bacterium]